MQKQKVELVGYDGKNLKPISEKKAQKFIEGGLASFSGDRLYMNVSLREAVALTKSPATEEDPRAVCWACGKATLSSGNKGKRAWCDKCRDAHTREQTAKAHQYLVLQSELMVERAVKLLEAQEHKVDILEYKEAIGAVTERIKEDPYKYKFDSAHEILTAIELINNQIKIKVHPSIGSLTPDFMLPEENIVLEVDGHFHQYSRAEDKKRDIYIRTTLGAEWEVVRIPAEYLEQNIAKLTDAILEIRDYMQRERKKNGGILPESFSKRDKAFWRSARSKK